MMVRASPSAWVKSTVLPSRVNAGDASRPAGQPASGANKVARASGSAVAAEQPLFVATKAMSRTPSRDEAYRINGHCSGARSSMGTQVLDMRSFCVSREQGDFRASPRARCSEELDPVDAEPWREQLPAVDTLPTDA